MVLLRNEASWALAAAMSVFYLLFLISILCCSSVSGQFSDDRMALLEFKDSVSDPYGILQSWSADSFNYCSWFGVFCNSNLRVSRLEINGRNSSQMNGKLIGRFSGILGNLRDLKVLSLPFNEFHGAVPVEIWGLRNLEVLDLQGNQLDGDLSSFNFTGLRRLRVLNLASNEFSGLFPASLSKCKGLRILNLANNAINDVIPGFITSFKRLKVINLSFNKLCGYVPSYSGYCTNLKHLDLSNNFLKGNIPRSLGSCLQLRTLLLSSNALDGAIPEELGDLRSLEVLDVSRNFLHGPIPLDLGNCTNLSILVLSSHSTTLSRRQHPHGDSSYRENPIRESCCCNSFNGSLPDEITTLPNLKILWAPCAALSGNFPSKWGSCERLKMVNLAHNFFTGSFSSLITKCVDLQYLNLSYNRLNERLDENLNALSMKISWQCTVKVSSMRMRLASSYKPEAYFLFFSNEILLSEYGLIGRTLRRCNGSTESISVSKTRFPVRLSQDSVIAKMRAEISKRKGSLILGVSVIVTILAALLVFFCCINKNKAGVTVADLEPYQMENIAAAQTINHTNKLTIFNDIGVELTYESILEATENFNRRNCIGNGGFGSTYKAEVGAGCVVAVKRLMGERHQGAPQMYAEVTTLGRINHPHLITLIGYYAGPTEMFLVYNYLSGGNLDRFITDRERRIFNFGILHKISLHIASALSYLHDQCDPCVLHRDIKPSNILLDGDYNAYLSDFGLSKILPVATTHATTRVAGTYGYIAPEYAETGRVSDKVDVYSYGVVMLELLSDKRALDPSFSMHEHGFDITKWAKMMSRQGQYKDIFTARLWDSGPRDKLLKILSLAVLCTNHESAARPAMKQVVRRLRQL